MNDSLQITQPPKMTAQMVIRKPVREVFEAFINPDITSKFWFSKGSAPLQTDTTVTWEWEMYNVSAVVKVVAIEQDKSIIIDWGDEENGFTRVEWQLEATSDTSTFVTITEQGFAGTGDEVLAKALDSMGGFSYVLAGAKAWLEHDVALRLVEDHAPTA